MRWSAVLGGILVVIGLLLLYLLRDLLFKIIIFVLGFIGIVIGLVLIGVGLGLIFGPRRMWRTRFE